MTGEEDPLGELIALSQELGLYDQPPQVCTTHGNIEVCRARAGCEWTDDPGAVTQVMREQLTAAARRPGRGKRA